MDHKQTVEHMVKGLPILPKAGYHYLNAELNNHKKLTREEIDAAFNLIIMSNEVSKKAFVNNKLRKEFTYDQSKQLINAAFQTEITKYDSMFYDLHFRYYRQFEMKEIIKNIVKRKPELAKTFKDCVGSEYDFKNKLKRLKLPEEIEEKFIAHSLMGDLAVR